MDLDTTRNKNAHHMIISEFENRKIDILVGTQMVAKGLDFDNVSVVGILNADTMLNFPDFRSFERGFQLMAQVGGRAGRKIKQGKVILQTYDPRHKVIARVLQHDYSGMFEDEMKARKEFNYPPFCRLVEVILKHKDRKVLNEGSVILGNALKEVFGNRVLGPEYPLVARVKTYYQKQILLKIETTASVTKAKILLGEVLDQFQISGGGKKFRIQVNVDPM
jgi:primosomal protein N' (replication factor Y)